jgi:hypothetical protein
VSCDLLLILMYQWPVFSYKLINIARTRAEERSARAITTGPTDLSGWASSCTVHVQRLASPDIDSTLRRGALVGGGGGG